MVAKALGAEVVLTDAAEGVKGMVERAEQLNAWIPNSHILHQVGTMKDTASVVILCSLLAKTV